jgi:hypothetical protein
MGLGGTRQELARSGEISVKFRRSPNAARFGQRQRIAISPGSALGGANDPPQTGRNPRWSVFFQTVANHAFPGWTIPAERSSGIAFTFRRRFERLPGTTCNQQNKGHNQYWPKPLFLHFVASTVIFIRLINFSTIFLNYSVDSENSRIAN